MTEIYQCLRSGACCTSFEVRGVPGYPKGVKPEQEACIHLVRASKDRNGIWHRARCQLHGTPNFPAECASFNFAGPGGVCGLGLAVWKSRGIVNPQDQLRD